MHRWNLLMGTFAPLLTVPGQPKSPGDGQFLQGKSCELRALCWEQGQSPAPKGAWFGGAASRDGSSDLHRERNPGCVECIFFWF